MKYSFNWLKDFLKTEKSAEEIGEDLVSLGSDVEEILSFPQIDDKVILVEIKEINPHPNADRLRLAKIDLGHEEIQIVCGAPNIEVGQKAAFAQIGARVLDFVIEEADIRGVKSPGMLLSPRELGVSADHRGIYIFDCNVEIGQKVADLLKKERVLDLEITPNRGDLLSHFGLARDLSAKYGSLLERPDQQIEFTNKEPNLAVEIKSDKCSLYIAQVIKGVKVAQSPDWLKERLIAVGAKPINNIVDVTNYIMLDLGQPLHAFDKNKLVSDEIEIKEIENEMDVATLDGEARAVLPGMLGIWDGDQPIAIAGVMGLGNSEVDDATTDIVLEAAVFDRKSIRKTAKLLNLKTEASSRFERGVDDAGTGYAILKAAKLIQEVAGGEVCDAIIAGKIQERKNIKIEYEKINSYANLNLTNDKINKSLVSLGFEVNSEQAIIPSWRHDIAIWQDLAEEVYRIHGLEKIEPISLPELEKPEPSEYYKKEKIKDYLTDIGLDEAISYTFLSDDDVIAAKLDPSDLLEVANPVQEENRYLRNSLIPGLLKAVAKNPSFDDIELFELGTVFSKTDEWFSLGVATSGKSARDINKIIDSLCTEFSFNKEDFKIFEINQEELKRFKIKKPFVMVAEAKIPDLLNTGKFNDLRVKNKQSEVIYRPISKFPPVKRDLAFIVDISLPADEAKGAILEISEKVILVELFDEFEADKLGIGKKSLAYHVWLEDQNKTLSDQEADEIISKIVDELKDRFGAELRR